MTPGREEDSPQAACRSSPPPVKSLLAPPLAGGILRAVTEPLAAAALMVATALLAGVVAQALALHLRIPGIVLLLLAGVLLGPDGANVIRPAVLGGSLHLLVGFAVSVILFEGGLNLDVRSLRREAAVIRKLVVLGGLLTAVGAAAGVRLVMGWGWRDSILFGTLVMVTGPTVVTPIVRRIGLERHLRTILEAEGVFVDALGALVAVVALEIALQPDALVTGIAELLASRLGTGAVAGVAGGFAIAVVLRVRAVPEGLENVFTLASVLALYQGSNAAQPESGILAVVLAGAVVGNMRVPLARELMLFKEQLTVLLLGMLFVLLAADVRLADVRALGTPGLLALGWLVVVVRPVAVALCTAGSDLGWRDRAFLSWLAPRGIVAAAVASLFVHAMEEQRLPGGHTVRALVFLVIAGTVVVQGLTAGLVARILRVRRPSDSGYVILGANALARAVGRLLRRAGEEAVFVDANPDACRAAEAEGFRVVFGRNLEPRSLQRADPEIRRGVIALTENEGVNLIFARTARERFKVPRVWAAVHRGRIGVTVDDVRAAGGATLFGSARDLDLWIGRCESGRIVLSTWKATEMVVSPETIAELAPEGILLPAVLVREGEARPVGEKTDVRPGDVIHLVVALDRAGEVREWMERNGWAVEATPQETTGRVRPGRLAGSPPPR